MARKPIHLDMKGLQTPRERMWTTMLARMRTAGEFTVKDIEDGAHPISEANVRRYLRHLQAAKLAEQLEPAQPRGRAQTSARWKLLVKWGIAPRVNAQGHVATVGLGIVAMWRAAKIRRTFTARDLARDASVNEVQVSLAAAKTYCQALTRSGHFAVVAKGTGGEPSHYRVARDTGPHAPAITRARTVFDRNTGDIQPIQSAQEVLDAIG